MTRESWRPVVGYEDQYEVSNKGRLSCRRRGSNRRVIRSPYKDKDGYLCVGLSKDGQAKAKKIHRAVLEAFVGVCPKGLMCAHLNGIRNDNRLENLIWATPTESMSHKKIHGTERLGENHHRATLTNQDVLRIREMLAEEKPNRKFARGKYTYKDIAETFNMRVSNVANISCGLSWKTIR